MTRSGQPASLDAVALDRPANRIALMSLRAASLVASHYRVARWEFAIEIEHLLAAGTTPTALRELRCSGLIEAALETTPHGAVRRRFKKIRSLTLPPRSCLVLTSAGDRFAAANIQHLPNTDPAFASGLESSRSVPQPVANHSDLIRPHWDERSRTLFFDGQIVKRLQRPARNQATILDAFQEEGWPSSIYDPLPPIAGITSKRRLHNAINKLNSGILIPLVHFYGNGDGLAVCWQCVQMRNSNRFISRSERNRCGAIAKPLQW
jgi:hypothetical protein